MAAHKAAGTAGPTPDRYGERVMLGLWLLSPGMAFPVPPTRVLAWPFCPCLPHGPSTRIYSPGSGPGPMSRAGLVLCYILLHVLGGGL